MLAAIAGDAAHSPKLITSGYVRQRPGNRARGALVASQKYYIRGDGLTLKSFLCVRMCVCHALLWHCGTVWYVYVYNVGTSSAEEHTGHKT